MASSNGSAKLAPIPRRNVRRGNAFLVMIIVTSSLFTRGGPSPRSGRSACGDPYAQRRCATHLKRRALHDSEDERRDAEILRPRLPNDGAYRRRIVVLHSS